MVAKIAKFLYWTLVLYIASETKGEAAPYVVVHAKPARKVKTQPNSASLVGRGFFVCEQEISIS